MKKFSMMMVGAAALAMFVSQSASALSLSDLSGLGLNKVGGTLYTTETSTTQFIADLATAVGSPTSSAYTSLKSLFDSTYGFTDSIALVSSVSTSTKAGKRIITTADFTSTLIFTDATFNPATVSAGGHAITFASAAAVPGPVAGAGLPVALLALGGFAFWRNRRNAA